MATPPHPSIDQQLWLDREIPHRVCAALTWLEMPSPWAEPVPKPQGSAFYKYCIGRSVDEGRKAAMRWLIEFVGITRDEKTKKAQKKVPHKNGCDVMIDEFNGGSVIDHNHASAQLIADVWKGCSQSSMHATTATGHPAVGPAELREALLIVVKHLEKHLYEPNDRNLLETVRAKF